MTREDIVYIINKSIEILNRAKGVNFEIVEIKRVDADSCTATVKYKFPNGSIKTLHWNKAWLDDLSFDSYEHTETRIPECENPKDYAIMKMMAYLWKYRNIN